MTDARHATNCVSVQDVRGCGPCSCGLPDARREPVSKCGDWSYCPACGGEIDTGWECNRCGRDWLEYAATREDAIRVLADRLAEAERQGESAKAELNRTIDGLQSELADAQATIARLDARLARYDRWTPEHNIEQWPADVQARLTASEQQVARLEGIIKRNYLHRLAPCCLCGYNGPGYYQPDQHECMRETGA